MKIRFFFSLWWWKYLIEKRFLQILFCHQEICSKWKWFVWKSFIRSIIFFSAGGVRIRFDKKWKEEKIFSQFSSSSNESFSRIFSFSHFIIDDLNEELIVINRWRRPNQLENVKIPTAETFHKNCRDSFYWMKRIPVVNVNLNSKYPTD